MKFDSQKAFPYPVLRPDIDDYTDGAIQVTVDVTGEEDGGVGISADFAISVSEIPDQVAAGAAAYVLVVACRETYYRDAIKSTSPRLEKGYPADTLQGEVTVFPYVVAEKPIVDFASSDINSEFGDGPFQYSPGEVLAVDEPKIVYLQRELFKPISSVFDLVAKESISNFEFRISLDQDRVQIQVSHAQKAALDEARNNKANKAVLINSVYMSAVTEAVDKLKTSGDELGEYSWAKIIAKQSHNLGISLEGNESYIIAQLLMRHPIQLLGQYVFKPEGSQ